MTPRDAGHTSPGTHPPQAASSHLITTEARAPLYRRLARKEARLREDQFIALSRLVRILARRRTNRSGPRLTENTLIRVAIDLLLARADQLAGDTEDEIRASALTDDRPAAAGV
jgi:RNA polymerase-interacting CarD/CdnL/TRCF family regulator